MEKIWLKHYPAKVRPEINPDQFQSVGDVFLHSCQTYKNQIAFSNMGHDITFEELEELSKDFAAFLTGHLGLKKGDRIALQMPNLLQYPVCLFGALRAGLIVVNTNPLYTTFEMEHQFKDSGAQAIVILANFASKLEAVIKNTSIEHVIVTEVGDALDFPKSMVVNQLVKHVKKMVPAYNLPKAFSYKDALKKGTSHDYHDPTVTNEDIAFLQYTGGTTGVAKGAMLTHRNIVANMLQIIEWMGMSLERGKEYCVTPLPLYHIFSLTVNCLGFMFLGGRNMLVTNPKDIPAFIKLLQKNRFTVMTGVNTLFNALMNHPEFTDIDFSHLKISVAGGTALQTAVAQRWKNLTHTNIAEGFGMTECSPVAAVNPINGQDKMGTIGMPVPSTEIKLADDDGNEVAPGKAGELWIRGPQVMKGYWHQEEETKKTITPDGWLKSGDIAVFDQDGFLKIVDRKKDMILVSGFNVYPNEIEDVVAQMDSIAEVAAIGVPDEQSGEAVKIFVVAKKPVTQEEIIKFARQHLTGYKVPKHVEFRTELPKSNVGKILRKELRTKPNA